MKTRTRRILIVAAVLFVMVCSIAGWIAAKTAANVVAWARDLPNRVLIDDDAIANAIGQAATESYHLALRDGDAAIQLQILDEQFLPLIRQNAEGAAWIRNVYRDDIIVLVDSDNTAVSDAASNLLSLIDAEPPAQDAR